MRIGILISSGGMPSSHAATVTAMATAIGRLHGVSSTYFALAFIFSLVVMYDAAGVRWETGEQAKMLNILVQDLRERENREVTFRHFKELVGHTPLQVFAGMILGLVIPFLVGNV